MTKAPIKLTGVYAELQVRVELLKKLLDAPEPGLWSWCDFVARAVKAIADLYGEHV